MISAEYVLLACFFVALAIVVGSLRRYNMNWIAKDLRLDDLQALARVANGKKRFGVGRDKLYRLSKRGFAAEDSWGGCRITLKGRYAAFLLRGQPPLLRDDQPTDGSPDWSPAESGQRPAS